MFAVIGSSFIAKITVSSANTPVPVLVGRSNVYIKYRIGFKTLPLGKPALIW